MSASALLRLVRKKAVFLYGLAKIYGWYRKRPFFRTDWRIVLGVNAKSQKPPAKKQEKPPAKIKKSLPQKKQEKPPAKNQEKPPAKIKKILPHPLPQKIQQKNFNNPRGKLCRGRKFGYICMLLNL